VYPWIPWELIPCDSAEHNLGNADLGSTGKEFPNSSIIYCSQNTQFRLTAIMKTNVVGYVLQHDDENTRLDKRQR